MNFGCRIGAFFDLDGTLLAPPSLERRFALFLLRRSALGPAQGVRWLAQFLRTACFSFRVATEANKAYLHGVPLRLAEEWAASLKRTPLPWFAEGLRRIEWHAARGHRIYLVSGTLAPLARIAAHTLPARIEIHATEIETSLGRWTGKRAGELISGDAKAHVVAHVAGRDGIDLPHSFAYGDSIADAPMLHLVGNPAAVNLSPRLKRLALERRWLVIEWHNRPAVGGPSRRGSPAVLRDGGSRFSVAQTIQGQG
jgi:HAD superfamily hydrolase (TIGR01490 family)